MRDSRPELLAPAGTIQKARVAFLYGADAVYLAGGMMGLRQAAGNFSRAGLTEIISFAHNLGRRVYVAINAFAFDSDFAELADYLRFLDSIRPDALIISDAGVFALAKKTTSIALHISTQASTTSAAGVGFWTKSGARRVILARELGADEIAAVAAETDTELEVFIHGSLCVSYSGKCVISNYSAQRDANRGGCVHSCRYRYAIEDGDVRALMNSRDMLGLYEIPALVRAGVASFKIEGRMKSALYLANAVSVYRRMLDACMDGREPDADFVHGLADELRQVRNRGFAGFPEPGFAGFIDTDGGQDKGALDFAGLVRENVPGRGALLHVKSDFARGAHLDLLLPRGGRRTVCADSITDLAGRELDRARADSLVFIPFADAIEPYAVVCLGREAAA